MTGIRVEACSLLCQIHEVNVKPNELQRIFCTCRLQTLLKSASLTIFSRISIYNIVFKPKCLPPL
jgi:hypothetical protein